MRIKIVSDGTAPGTEVRNAETGEMLDGVVGVQWTCEADGRGLATVNLRMENVEAEVVGELRLLPGQKLSL